MLRYDESARNVLGGELEPCSNDPVTGFYRNGCCETGPHDLGLHTVCAVMTAEFLSYSKRAGNDLSTPLPEYGRPRLSWRNLSGNAVIALSTANTYVAPVIVYFP